MLSKYHKALRRAWQPTPFFLPGESYGQKSLAGYSPSNTESPTQLKQLSTAHKVFIFLISFIELITI